MKQINIAPKASVHDKELLSDVSKNIKHLRCLAMNEYYAKLYLISRDIKTTVHASCNSQVFAE